MDWDDEEGGEKKGGEKKGGEERGEEGRRNDEKRGKFLEKIRMLGKRGNELVDFKNPNLNKHG